MVGSRFSASVDGSPFRGLSTAAYDFHALSEGVRAQAPETLMQPILVLASAAPGDRRAV